MTSSADNPISNPTDDTRLQLALALSDLAVWDMDVTEDRITWDQRGEDILGLSGTDGLTLDAWIDRTHPEDRGAILAMKTAVLEDPTHHEIEIGFRFCRPDGAWRSLTKRARVRRDDDGRPVAILAVVSDVTARREVETQQQRLLSELQHRIKNMVAIIRSMAQRTRENSVDLDGFSTHFEGRLGVFARTHSALARTRQGEVSLEELLREELRQHSSPDAEPWTLEGPLVMLRQKPAEIVALALHELAINAVKFGALSDPQGMIDVRWTLNGQTLSLDWIERGAAPILNRGRPGFGTDVIQNALPYQLGAETRMTFRPTGLHCQVSLPLERE